MSLDKLAVIFIIIILPISVVLNVYTDAQIKTLNLQLSYDTKLSNATSDAIKAYQLNAFNESTSDLSESKMRDINAAANTFFNSLGTNFNMDSFSIETLQSYVPALVFTMYDGYYIYSKYYNTLTDVNNIANNSKYQANQLLYGTKPFVSYSCRYKNYPKLNDDFVISYTLDNYITIQGTINGNWVNDSGYLIDISNKSTGISYEAKNTNITYRGAEIGPEGIKEEYVGTKKYKYQKINGVKYYYDKDRTTKDGTIEPKWFSLINGSKTYTNEKFNLYTDYSAYNYYKDAYEFTYRVLNEYGLNGLNVNHSEIKDKLDQSAKDEPIFGAVQGKEASERIEEPDSNFNEHRQAVIKYTIEKNLSIAIKNYNRFDNGVEANFEMPKLDETEWDKIQSNMTLITFLQGMPIGGKIYNGCCVVANNKNDEVIAEESIYLANKDINNYYYYRPTYKKFEGSENLTGVLNVDLERRSIESGDASIEPDYFYPQKYYASYDSIVSPSENVNLYAETTDNDYQYAYNGNIYKYMNEKAKSNVKNAYFSALGRERNNSYKINKVYQIPADAKIFQNNNHRYYMYNLGYEVTWDKAEAICESKGGHLITVNSFAEMDFIIQNVITPGNAFWCGYIDDANGWITGENTGFNDWKGINNIRSKYQNSCSAFICEWE